MWDKHDVMAETGAFHWDYASSGKKSERYSLGSQLEPGKNLPTEAIIDNFTASARITLGVFPSNTIFSTLRCFLAKDNARRLYSHGSYQKTDVARALLKDYCDSDGGDSKDRSQQMKTSKAGSSTLFVLVSPTDLYKKLLEDVSALLNLNCFSLTFLEDVMLCDSTTPSTVTIPIFSSGRSLA